MSDPEKARKIAENQPVLGTAIGAIITYWLSADETGSSQVLLASVTPLAMAVDRAIFSFVRYLLNEHQRKRKQSEYSAAIAHLDSEISNPNLPPSHKNQLQDMRQGILIDQVASMAYNQPQPSNNNKPIIQKPRVKQSLPAE